MFDKRRRPTHADERAAIALDFQVLAERDPELRDLQIVASALRPSIHPDEDFRAALKDRLMRGVPDREPTADAGSQDPKNMTANSAVHVLTGDGARVVLADVEEIDPERAQAAAVAVESIIAANRARVR